MKKALYFMPSILAFMFFVFIMLILGRPTSQLDDYLISIGIFLIFFVSDWLLSKKKWYGCIPGILLGAYIIYDGSSYHGQIFDERSIGIVIVLYYLLVSALIYKKNKSTSNFSEKGEMKLKRN